AMVRDGAIGKIRLVEAEFSIGVPGVALEPADPARRHWRFRVDQEGKAALLGEAGSHAYHMVGYVTGLTATGVRALMSTYAQRREVQDSDSSPASVGAGVGGRLWHSSVPAGNDHARTRKLYGETGNRTWGREEGGGLAHKPMGGPAIRLARGY